MGNDNLDAAIRAALASDPELKKQLIDKVVATAAVDPDVLDDIADELADVLEKDPTYSKAIVSKVLGDESTRELVVSKLVEEME